MDEDGIPEQRGLVVNQQLTTEFDEEAERAACKDFALKFTFAEYMKLNGEDFWLARARIAHTALSEATARHDARVTELLAANNVEVERRRVAERRVRVLEAALIVARDTFSHYGDLHAAKPDEAKARRNYDLAKQMDAALSASPDTPTDQGEV